MATSATPQCQVGGTFTLSAYVGDDAGVTAEVGVRHGVDGVHVRVVGASARLDEATFAVTDAHTATFGLEAASKLAVAHVLIHDGDFGLVIPI